MARSNAPFEIGLEGEVSARRDYLDGLRLAGGVCGPILALLGIAELLGGDPNDPLLAKLGAVGVGILISGAAVSKSAAELEAAFDYTPLSVSVSTTRQGS